LNLSNLADIHHSSQTILLAGTLVAARLAPIIQMVPLLGGSAIPQIVKMGLTFALTLILLPLLISKGVVLDEIPTGLNYVACLLKEGVYGFTIGFFINAIFESLRIAGQFIDQVRGQTQSTIMLPFSKQRASVTGVTLYQLGVAILFALGGHLLVIKGIVRTYQTLGPFEFPNVDNHAFIVEFIIRAISDIIIGGVLFAFPVVAAVLLADIVLGLINKSAPQINVFFLGMPLKSAIGVGVLCLGIGILSDRFVDQFAGWMNRVDVLIEAMGPKK